MTERSSVAIAADLRPGDHLLVCLRWGIGDLVMQLPLLRGLRRALPDVHLTAMGADPALQLLDGEDVVDDVLAVQRFGFRHWGDAGDEGACRAVTDWCRRRGIRGILDGSHAPRGVRMALETLHVAWRDTGAWLDAAPGHGHGLDLLREAARAAWGIEPDARPPWLRLGGAERAEARRLQQEALEGATSPLGIAPAASSPLKRGGAEAFAAAADRLVESRGCRVLIFEGREHGAGRRTLEAMRHRRSAALVPPLHLRRTAALLARCRAVICNDSGLMHVAAAVGAPVVAVFACTNPELYLPPGGAAVGRWNTPCRHLEAEQGRFGITPCVDAGRCLDPAHRREEDWADAAVLAASRLWTQRAQ